MQNECTRLLAMKQPKRPLPLTSRHNLRDFPTFSPAATLSSMKSIPRSSHSHVTDRHINGSDEYSNHAAQHPVSEPSANSTAHLGKTPTPSDGSVTPKQTSLVALAESVIGGSSTPTPGGEYQELGGERPSCVSTASTLSSRSLRQVQIHSDKSRSLRFPGIEITVAIQQPCSGTMSFNRTSASDSANDERSISHVVQLEEFLGGHEVTLEKGETDTSLVLHFASVENVLCCLTLEWA
jgi:hypothetical protein